LGDFVEINEKEIRVLRLFFDDLAFPRSIEDHFRNMLDGASCEDELHLIEDVIALLSKLKIIR
jgi:hypothetical protein